MRPDHARLAKVFGMNQKIKCLMSHNEKKSSRAAGLAKAIADDNRFELPVFQDINVDVQFSIKNPTWIEVNGELVDLPRICFNVELKEPADYISSTLGPDGHIAMQYLDGANIFLVLGNDWDVSKAIRESCYGRYKGDELTFQIRDIENRLRDFEANAFALNAPVFRWGFDRRDIPDEWKAPNPYQRLLSVAHKVLTGGSMAGYAPRPKDAERESFAANCLFRGIGHETLANVLREYKVALVPRKPNPRPVEDLPGVGPKRAGMLQEKIVMVYGGLV